MVNDLGNQSARAAHFSTMEKLAADAAANTRFPQMRDQLLKLAAAWHDLASKTEYSEHQVDWQFN
jgi:hypothetical protein